MKKQSRFLLATLTFCILTGCNQSGGDQQNTTPDNKNTAASDQTNAGTTEAALDVTKLDSSLPVISIETVKQDANVLDFVTKPVASHVSAMIQTWTPGYVMPPAPYYEDCTVTVYEDGKTAGTPAAAQVKVRGNWTTNYAKKPLRLKFGEKQNLLGLNNGTEQKNWVLLAEYKDASMLRDKAMLGISRDILKKNRLYSSDTTLAEVQINGQYWGVYLVAEQQQVGKDRVDITKNKKDYTGTDIGYFLEFDGYFYNEEPLNQFHVDYADNAALTPYDGEGGDGRKMSCLPEDEDDDKNDIGFTIKSEIHSQEQHDFIAKYVNNVYKIMYAAAYENKAYEFNADYSDIAVSNTVTPQQAVEAVVDVRSLADAYIINEIACDADIYWSSFYMSADFGEGGDKKLTFEAPWDFDSALGNKNRCPDGTGFYAANIVPDVNGNMYETINPWLAVLMYQNWFQEEIRAEWTTHFDNGTFSNAVSMIRSETEKHEDAFTRNNERWKISTLDKEILSELCRGAARCGTQKEASDYLADWLEKRIQFLNEHWHTK
ncbi:MAG: CotH kinase family protein [Oscillospiraceae bacterium]|nr:CotH kinase family protein [Oscillospiraceae bacterium]